MATDYNINPNGGSNPNGTIGQAGAQVFDLGITERNLARNAAAEEAKRAAKLKREQAIQDDVNANLAKMGQIAIMPKDQALFAQDATKIRDHVKQNIDALKNGDVNAMMQFQQMYGDYMTKAEQSKNFREKWEENGQMIAKEPDSYDQEVKNAHMERASSIDAGNWVEDPNIYHKTINYNDRLMDQLRPFAEQAATQSIGRKVYTLPQAEEDIARDLENPAIYNQATRDFEKAKAAGVEMGAKDAIDYYKKKYAPKLVVNDRTPIPEAYMGEKKKPLPGVSSVVTQDDETGETVASINFTDKPENPPLVVGNPKVPGQTLKVVPMAVVKKKNGDVVLRASTLPTGEGENREEGKIVELPYNIVSDVMKNTFGIKNPWDLLVEGTVPEHVTVKRTNVTPKEEKKKTSTPQKGDEMAVQGGTAVYNGTKWVMKK